MKQLLPLLLLTSCATDYYRHHIDFSPSATCATFAQPSRVECLPKVGMQSSAFIDVHAVLVCEVKSGQWTIFESFDEFMSLDGVDCFVYDHR